MSHDLYATWASSEIANIIKSNQSSYYSKSGYLTGWTVAAGKEGGRLWPLADGVISSYNSACSDEIHIAVEFKKVNEGLHGTLTALGQSLAYLHKGYHASIIIIPDKYISHNSPATHLNEILQLTANALPIGIFSYEEPDISKINPFENKIKCYRQPDLSFTPLANKTTSARTHLSTLWAHVREGMSYPDIFYKYCKMVKFVTTNLIDKKFILPTELINAISRLEPKRDPYKYLSYTNNNSILDRAWLNTWFEYYFHALLIPIFTKDSKNKYRVNDVDTLIYQNNNKFAKLFSGRSNSIKETLVNKLNAGKISEDKAWEEYALKVRNSAHSYREVIDSGLYHLNLIDNNGNLTKVGYSFVDEADKGNSVYTPTSMQILRGAALVYGNFSAFLHYIYKLSEDKFNINPTDFTKTIFKNNSKELKFKTDEYKTYLYTEMRDKLSLILTSSNRSQNNPRKAFQAEIPFLKYLGIIPDVKSPFRIGAGILINWPIVQESIEYMYNNNL